MDASHSEEILQTSTHQPDTHKEQRLFQNFVIVWLEPDMIENEVVLKDSIFRLRHLTNNIHSFTQFDECIEFLTEIDQIKAYFITTLVISQKILSIIHDMPQISSFYIIYNQANNNQTQSITWKKIRGIFTEITTLVTTLSLDIMQSNRNSLSISFLPLIQENTQIKTNELDPTFMLTKLFKEIVLEMDYDDHVEINDFVELWKSNANNNPVILNTVNNFQDEYKPDRAIWWYSKESFIFQSVNYALRTYDIELMMKMGFIIRDLHRHIESLHQEQFISSGVDPFKVFRGQGLSSADFNKLLLNIGGLIAFNNFLSTSRSQVISFSFAAASSTIPDTIGIIFEIGLEFGVYSTVFSDIRQTSQFGTEEEILFSMNSIFRIMSIDKPEDHNQIWKVQLKFTNDDDPQLTALTNYTRKGLAETTGWLRMGIFMLMVGHFRKAEELLMQLIEYCSSDWQRSRIYNWLGIANAYQGRQREAIEFSEKALDFARHISYDDDTFMASCYNSIGCAYCDLGDYKKALHYYVLAHQIKQQCLPPNDPLLAISYNNIAAVHEILGEFSAALECHEMAYTIAEKALPSSHPSLAASCNNIGAIHEQLSDYSTALNYYQKAYSMRVKALPSNHVDIATSYNNIAGVYETMGELLKALEYYEKANEIFEKCLSPSHPSLATLCNNIGSIYYKMGEYSKALKNYEQSLRIRQESLNRNHPDVASSCNNIGTVYRDMGDHRKSLEYHEKATAIFEEILPSNHPSLGTSYNNIGVAYKNLDDYSKALKYYQKAYAIFDKSLPSDHPSLATSCNNIGTIYFLMGEYKNALHSYDQALRIRENTIHTNHLDLASSYNNIGLIHYNLGDFSTALEYHEKAVKIHENLFPNNHSTLATSYGNLGQVHTGMGNYVKALEYHKRTKEFYEKHTIPKHPSLGVVCHNIGQVHYYMGEYMQALASLQEAQEIYEETTFDAFSKKFSLFVVWEGPS